jgi:hypothetical protein
LSIAYLSIFFCCWNKGGGLKEVPSLARWAIARR